MIGTSARVSGSDKMRTKYKYEVAMSRRRRNYLIPSDLLRSRRLLVVFFAHIPGYPTNMTVTTMRGPIVPVACFPLYAIASNVVIPAGVKG
jgi:hypothetical protein